MKPIHAIRPDREIRAAVLDELAWTPEVQSDGIRVQVANGCVTLSGEVDTYSEYCAAKRAALRVRGARALIDELAVSADDSWPSADGTIQDAVQHALKWSSNVPSTVHATVTDHTVTLSGTVSWDFQRRAAERAVQHVRGIRTVINRISLTARQPDNETEMRIRTAIARNAILDADTIRASVVNGKVTLTGRVRSWAERTQAEHAAWASPSVREVRNDIVVVG